MIWYFLVFFLGFSIGVVITSIVSVGRGNEAYQEGFRNGKRLAELAEEIEPKKGKWVEDEYWDYKCSACGKGIDDEIYLFMPYCPNCGARMERSEDERTD